MKQVLCPICYSQNVKKIGKVGKRKMKYQCKNRCYGIFVVDTENYVQPKEPDLFEKFEKMIEAGIMK